jgi:pantoate--beta-alanine ligase
MIIFKYASQLAGYLQQQKTAGKVIGFVPTMGALHNGHIALVDQSKKEASLTICSIFVNPTQFNNPNDYQLYPNTIEADIAKLEAAGCDVLFLPAIAEMYPRGTAGLEQYDLGYLETLLEGKYRPGHFQGVCQVMFRLLTMVQPDKLFMGQKDYQQCMVVNRLLQLMQSGTRLITCPTLREPDGLAMSSRNMRLTAEDRQKATTIYKCLTPLLHSSLISVRHL